MFYVISFASQGLPFDKGINLSSLGISFGNYVKASGIENFQLFTPASIQQSHPELEWSIVDWGIYHAVTVNPRYHSVGLGAWRIALIDYMLTKSGLQDGDILCFHDVNYVRDKDILTFAKNTKRYLECIQGIWNSLSVPELNRIL